MKKTSLTAQGATVTKVNHPTKSQRQLKRTEKFTNRDQETKEARKIALKINRVFKRHTLTKATEYAETWIANNLMAETWFKNNYSRLVEDCKKSMTKCKVTTSENWAVAEAKKDKRNK